MPRGNLPASLRKLLGFGVKLLRVLSTFTDCTFPLQSKQASLRICQQIITDSMQLQ
jgi:hypothetical protein